MPKSYLIDMDGVIVRGNELVPGADAFLQRLHDRQIKFLILTNNPQYTPVDLQYRLASSGVNITSDHIYTSALATAQFLKWQMPSGTAFVVGEVGLTEALHAVGYVLTEKNPDFVVLGETTSYSYGRITQAVRLISQGARFIATNPDPSGPGDGGLVPACGAIAALIETATGIKPYFIGKPNPLMMRAALRYLGEHSENTIMVGDRMDTDVRVGLESGLETILVLSGVTTSAKEIERYPYRPTRVVQSVAELEVD
jgi:NagD protein